MPIDTSQIPFRVPRDIEELKKLLQVEEACGDAELVKIYKKLIEHLKKNEK